MPTPVFSNVDDQAQVVLDEGGGGRLIALGEPLDAGGLVGAVEGGGEHVAPADVHDLAGAQEPDEPAQQGLHGGSSLPMSARYPPPSVSGVGESATRQCGWSRPSQAARSVRTAASSPRSTPTAR